MPYITAADVNRLTTCDRLKTMIASDVDMFIAGATSIINNYKLNTAKEGFASAAKLASMVLIDFLAFSNLAGGAFETERIGDKISYNMRDNGMKKKLQEVEMILSDFITSGGTKKIKRSRLVRRH